MKSAAALWITGVGPGRLSGRIITHVPAGDDGSMSAGTKLALEDDVAIADGAAIFLPGDRHVVRTPSNTGLPLPMLCRGDTILADDCTGWPGKDACLSVMLGTDVRILGHAGTGEKAVALVRTAVEADAGRTGSPYLGFLADLGKLSYEVAARLAAGEPDDALVFAWLDESGNLATEIVAHRGAYLFWATEDGHDCLSTGMADPDGPGLWLLRDGRSWTHHDEMNGEYDSGIDGKLEQTSIADACAHFAMDADAILAALDEAYPYHHGGDVLAAAMASPGPLPPGM